MGQERRRFFRIDDTIGVAYRQLTDEELESSGFEGIKPVDALSLIASFDNKLANLTGRLRGPEPLLAEIFETLNLKLNAVINQLELDSHLVKRVAHKVHEVNLSACGMAFFIDEPIDLECTISLEMSLKPSNSTILCFATIVASDYIKEDDHYYVRMDFANMSEHDQEVLIQHIVRRQGHQIRELRVEPLAEGEENSDENSTS